jgi:hypothetical protein
MDHTVGGVISFEKIFGRRKEQGESDENQSRRAKLRQSGQGGAGSAAAREKLLSTE